MDKNKENMTTKEEDKQKFDNTSLINIVVKYKWHILAITVAAALLGAFFSSSIFIDPLYKSEAVAYPSNVSTFSNENESEQMLQILSSQAIKDSIIEKYDLWKHYKVARDSKYAKSTLMQDYAQYVKITKTPYDAVSIEVLDKSPDTAALIANDILLMYDALSFNLHKEKYIETSDMLRSQMVRKQHDIDSMKSRLAELSQTYGLLDYESQSREVSNAFLSGSTKVVELKKSLEQYGPELIDLKTKIEAEANKYANLKEVYEVEYRYTIAKRSYYTLVTAPYPDDHKAYPVRWVIVLLSAVGACVLSVLVAFIIERKKKNG